MSRDSSAKINSKLDKKSYRISHQGYDHDKHVIQTEGKGYDQSVVGQIAQASIHEEGDSLSKRLAAHSSSGQSRKSVARSRSYISSSSKQAVTRPALLFSKSESGPTHHRKHKEPVVQPNHTASAGESQASRSAGPLHYQSRDQVSRHLHTVLPSSSDEDQELALALAENLKLEEERKAREQIEDAEFLKVLRESIVSERGARYRRRSSAIAQQSVDEEAGLQQEPLSHITEKDQESFQSQSMKKPSTQGQYRNASPVGKDGATRNSSDAIKSTSSRRHTDSSDRRRHDDTIKPSVHRSDREERPSRPGLATSLPNPISLRRLVNDISGHARRANTNDRLDRRLDARRRNDDGNETSRVATRPRRRHQKDSDHISSEKDANNTQETMQQPEDKLKAKDVKDEKRNRTITTQNQFENSKDAKVSATHLEEAQSIRSGEAKKKPEIKDHQSKRGTLRKLSIADVILSAKLTKPIMPPKLLECNTCLSDDIPENKIAKLHCGHNFCNDCLLRLFTLSLTDPQHMPPRCCQPNEHIPLKHVDKLLSIKTKSLWNKKYQEYTTANRIYCPQPDCGEWIRPRDITNLEGKDVGKCSRCKTSVCTLCGLKDHGKEDCPKDDELNQVREMGKEFGWQRCYNCRAMVELEKGCNHMTCRCTAEFCMICAAKWKTCNCPWFNFEAAEDDAPPPQFDEQGRLIFHDNDLAWGDRVDEAQVEEDERVARLLALDFEERLQDEEDGGGSGDGLWAPLLMSGIGEGVLRLLSRTRNLEGGAMDRVRTAYTTTLMEDGLVFGYSDNEEEGEIRRVRSEGDDGLVKVQAVGGGSDDGFEQPFFPTMLQRLQDHYRPPRQDDVYTEDTGIIARGGRIHGW